MRTKKKEAKFFCESCGNEVPRNSKTCPSCGKFFASVRCPKCYATGTNDEFKNGCPRCGYAINPDLLNGKGSYNFFNGSTSSKNKKASRRSGIDLSIFSKRKKSSYNPDSSLPLWVYIVTIVILIFLVIYLYSCL